MAGVKTARKVSGLPCVEWTSPNDKRLSPLKNILYFSPSPTTQPSEGTSQGVCAAKCKTTWMLSYTHTRQHSKTHRNTTLKSTEETSLNLSTVLGRALRWLTPLRDKRRLSVPMSQTARRNCSINGILCSTLIFAASQPISFWAGVQLCAAVWGRLLCPFSGMALCSVMKGKVISIHITLCGILAKWEKTYPGM